MAADRGLVLFNRGVTKGELKRAATIIILLIGLTLSPAIASAQSAIAGTVTDASGAVLPGVTVEASSPALIEKVRAATTDGQGRYTIVDLRPGLYEVTFMLPGFSTVKREGLELPANFTAPLNVQLSIGSVSETLTVTGQSPLVDVQSVNRTTQVSRDLLDVLPSGRSYRSISYLVPGVKASGPNVAEVGATVAVSFTHGTVALDTTVNVDGMLTNTVSGSNQQSLNDQMIEESTYVTGAVPAEVQGGGLVMNLVTRSGGNTFAGGGFFSGLRGEWQSDNITDELKAKGAAGQNYVIYALDENPWLSGPIFRNKLWFFGSHRYLALERSTLGSLNRDGSVATSPNYTTNYTARLTWQVSGKNKVTLLGDRAIRDLPGLGGAGVEPETASYRQAPSVYGIGQVKWTSVLSNSLLLESGYSSSVYTATNECPPGVDEPRGSPAWYAKARRQDLLSTAPGTIRGSCNATTIAGFGHGGQFPVAYQLSSSLSYVTGSNSLKVGVQDRFGYLRYSADGNGDLIQLYQNGVPAFVDVKNSPVLANVRMNGDIGVYVQGTLTRRRLTISPGVRYEHYNASIEEQSAPAGRFVPARFFPRVENIPNWNDVLPRLGVTFDVFGNATTAVKFSVGRYNSRTALTDFTGLYNPMSTVTDRRTWLDCALLPGTNTCNTALASLATNKDDIAQDNEIGPSSNSNFGTSFLTRRPSPDMKRLQSDEYMLSVQHQLLPRVAVTGAFFRRRFFNLPKQVNELVSFADYSSFQTPNPISGEAITLYNLNRAKLGLVSLVDTNSETAYRTYTGYEISFNARLPRGTTVFGGWTIEQNVSVNCDVADPNQLLYCDGSKLGIPFRHDFKVVGSLPTWKGFGGGLAFQSYAGLPLTVTWVVPANLFPGGRTQSVTVPIIPPGTSYFKRLNELDLTVRREFHMGRVTLTPAFDLFNVTNSSVVTAQNQSFGSSLGTPTTILTPRLPRLSVQMKF